MKRWMLVLGMVGLVTGCGSSGSGEGTTSAATAAPAGTGAATGAPAAAPAANVAGGEGVAGPATVEGARAVIATLQNAADPVAEVKKLKPGTAELKALFSDEAAAAAVGAEVEKMVGTVRSDSFPKGDPFVFCAPSDDVKKWTDDVNKNFPGGYKRLGPKLNGGVTMCKFKIGGIAFDSLVNISGKWFFVPKPFRVVKE